jgi:hypothetical protein
MIALRCLYFYSLKIKTKIRVTEEVLSTLVDDSFSQVNVDENVVRVC